jgi:hypothetical protein
MTKIKLSPEAKKVLNDWFPDDNGTHDADSVADAYEGHTMNRKATTAEQELKVAVDKLIENNQFEFGVK